MTLVERRMFVLLILMELLATTVYISLLYSKLVF